MVILLVIVLLVIVVIFGVSAGMQSYATAQQAQAQIETARVAQVNAWGNLVTILTLALVIVVALALMLLAIWLLYRKSSRRPARTEPHALASRDSAQQISTSELLQFLIIEKLMDKPSKPQNQLTSSHEEPSVEEEFPWLR